MADIGITVKGFDALAGKLAFTAKELNLRMKEVIGLNAISARANYKKTTHTWNNQPQFDIDVQKSAYSYATEIGTNDKIYKFIELGTRVRRALMTPDFRAKTKPGWLGSRKGKGGVAFISKKLALPGIVARNFRVPILRRAKTQLRKDSTVAVKSVLARFGN